MQKRRDYYENLYAKLENLAEMDKFLQTYDLSKLNQKEITDLKRPITSNDVESVYKTNKQTKNSQTKV